MAKLRESNHNETDEGEVAPVSKEQFAMFSLALVTALFLFLAVDNLKGVQASAVLLSITKISSWYYHDRKIDLFFAIAYLLAVAGWLAIL